MIELVFVACLVRDPSVCEEKSLLYLARDPNTTICVMQAATELATWVTEHPAYRVASWRCRDPQTGETRA